MEPGPKQVATVEGKIEAAKKLRSIRRRTLTIVINKITKILEDVESAEVWMLESLLNSTRKAGLALGKIDEHLLEILSSSDVSEEKVLDALDLEGSSELQFEYQRLASNLQEIIKVRVNDKKSNTRESGSSKKKYSLPSIELRQIDGRVETWIHDDASIKDDDKFLYLIKATEPETPASDLVERFSPSGTNYHNEPLKEERSYRQDEILSNSDKNQNALLSYKLNNLTLLQTLVVDLVYKNKVGSVRALFGSNAQHSNIGKDVKSLGLKPRRSESFAHMLFGGFESSVSKYNVHNVCKEDLFDTGTVNADRRYEPWKSSRNLLKESYRRESKSE